MRKLVYALKSIRIFGVQTNREYLIQALDPDGLETIDEGEFEEAALGCKPDRC